MGKMNISKSENGITGGKSQGPSRKLARQVRRKKGKINKAINCAKSKNTEACAGKDDVKFMKITHNKASTNDRNESTICNDIISALNGKIFANNKNINNYNIIGKPNKHSKKKSKNFKKKENNPRNENSSFKMSDKTNARLANLQEYVNKESQKMENQENNSKNSKVSSNVTCNGLIKDKQKLDDLLEGQMRDQIEVNKYARQLGLNARKKAKLHIDFEDDFERILQYIADGDFDKYKRKVHIFNNSADNCENDIMTSIGKKYPADKDVFSKSKSNDSISEQNRMEKTSENDKVSESDDEIDLDEETEKFPDTFIDDKAEEASDENDDDDAGWASKNPNAKFQ